MKNWIIRFLSALTLVFLSGFPVTNEVIAAGETWLSGWGNRIVMTIDHTKIDSSLSNFPVMVHLGISSGIGGTNVSPIFSVLGANSQKIAVTNEAGTQLYVEIERWDAAAKNAILWVKVPAVSNSVDTALYLYYDNAQSNNIAYVGAPGSAAGKNVWDNNFVGVWHLADTGNTIVDSSSRGHNGTGSGTGIAAPALAEGIAGGYAKLFDGITAYPGGNRIVVPDSPDFSQPTTGYLMYSFWIRPTTLNFPTYNDASQGYVRIFKKLETGAYEYDARIYNDASSVAPPGMFSIYARNSNPPSASGANACITEQGSITSSKWTYVTVLFDPAGARTWLNAPPVTNWHYQYSLSDNKGTFDEMTTGFIKRMERYDDPANNPVCVMQDTTAPLVWGAGTASSSNNGYFSGRFDEIRVSNAFRGEQWIKASFNAESDNLLKFTISGSAPVNPPAANQAPVLSSIGSKSVNEGSTLTFTISATDPENNPLTYSASNLPSGATFNTSTRTFAWTPSYSQAGSYPNVHFSVSDGSLTDSEDIAITVNNVNRAPVLSTIGNKSVNVANSLTFTISATDPDGNPLSYSTSNLPLGATFNASTRTFSWTPGLSQAGNYPGVRFSVSDGSLTDYEDITITVNNVSPTPVNPPAANQAPVLSSIGSKSVNEGSTLTFTISATDPENNPLTYSASNLPSGATFNTSTRTFAWTPSYSQAGSYPNVHFSVSDGSLTDSEDIAITVNNVNRAPVLSTIGNKSVNVANSLTFTISATDPNGNDLTYSASSLPSGASFNAPTHTFSWTPSSSQVGTYSNVHFQVTDGSLTDFEDITITVNNAVLLPVNPPAFNPPPAPVNHAPVLSAIGNKSIDEGKLLKFTISATDSDGNPLTYSASNLPYGATFNASTHTFSWTPRRNQDGTYHGVRFSVSDGSLTDYEDITITVNNVKVGHGNTLLNYTFLWTSSLNGKIIPRESFSPIVA